MFLIVKFIVFTVFLGVGYKSLKLLRATALLQMVYWIVFLRLALSSFFEITYPSLIAGQSLISLFSIVFTALLVGVLIYRKYPIVRSKDFWLIKIYIILLTVSGLLGGLMAAIPEIVKWIFLLCFIFVLRLSYEQNGIKNTLSAIAIAYCYPVVLLILSILLRVSKATEADGSVSYVGGFNHESAFSVIIYSSVVIGLAAFTSSWRFLYQCTFLLGGAALLILINYRTSVLGFMAFFLVFIFIGFIRAPAIVKALASFLAVLLVPLLGIIMSGALSERFEEIPQFLSVLGELMVPYDYYYFDDGRYFSGRIFLWNKYFMGWYESGLLQQAIGHGPGSWKSYYDVYAHNTFFSVLYEGGYLSLTVLLLIFVTLIYKLLRCISSYHGRVVFSGFTGFIVLNLATMPMWQMEGIILFGILASSASYVALMKVQNDGQDEQNY